MVYLREYATQLVIILKEIAEAVSIPEVICGSGRNLENCRLI
jgi:arginine decarboxylase-like protein